MTKKEFYTKFNCTDADLEQRINDGWEIQFMQFMSNDKLHVVFMREVPTAAAVSQPDGETVVEPVVAAAPRPIASRPPVPMTILGLDQPAYGEPVAGRSIPRTWNRFDKGSTRPVNVPDNPLIRTDIWEDITQRHQANVESILNQKSRPFGPQ